MTKIQCCKSVCVCVCARRCRSYCCVSLDINKCMCWQARDFKCMQISVYYAVSVDALLYTSSNLRKSFHFCSYQCVCVRKRIRKRAQQLDKCFWSVNRMLMSAKPYLSPPLFPVLILPLPLSVFHSLSLSQQTDHLFWEHWGSF